MNMLNKTADFYDEEVEQAIQTLTSMLEPIMIIIYGISYRIYGNSLNVTTLWFI